MTFIQDYLQIEAQPRKKYRGRVDNVVHLRSYSAITFYQEDCSQATFFYIFNFPWQNVEI